MTTQRPIKFRAWDKNHNAWYTAEDLERNKQIGWFFDPFVGSFFQVMEVGKPPRQCTEIELLQFTGLHDKNGKEIWEGDILQTTDLPKLRSKRTLVEWPFCGVQEIASEDEVIGNIYSNPDLLKNNN